MSNIQPSSVFVVSGGAKGITARCVERIAQIYHCGFILLGRSKLTDDPAWAQGAGDEAALKRAAMSHLKASGDKPTPSAVNRLARGVLSSREIRGTLQTITANGGRAVYASADITDLDAVRAALQDASDTLGPVTGLIHGAGNLADKRIEAKTAEDFDWVYAAKVHGLQNLLQAIPAGQIQQLVLFASVAGFYGNIGQADYALANEVLNKTAHWFKQNHPHAHVVSINWGPWESGMVTPALKAYFEQNDIKVIPVEVGAHLLVEELAGVPDDDAVQIVVGSGIVPMDSPQDDDLKTYHIHRAMQLEKNPFLQDHVVGGKAVLPMVNAFSWMCNTAANLYPGFQVFAFEDYRVLKGIIFDETLADDYQMTITETAKSQDDITVEAVITSQPPAAKLPRYHYRTRLMLVRKKPPMPRYDNMDLANRADLPGHQFYDDYTLFHGFAFKGVERVLNISNDQVTMLCRLPVVPRRYQGQFPVGAFNYFVTDIGLQSMGIYAKWRFGAGSLPLLAGSGEHFADVPWGGRFYVSLDIHHAAPTGLKTTIHIHDEDARIYQIVRNSEITISKNLNALFRQNKLPVVLG
jgi:NAD(P)-dependent dehydrogenase (short-subunit alcohol dehydrogenase family)